MKILYFFILFLLKSQVSSVSYVYPHELKINEFLLPEKGWSSVRQCPMRYFDVGNDDGFAPLNGRPAEDREFAHMVAIGWKDNDGNVSWNCGGSLIGENVVLTAAHCTQWMGKKPDVVRLGDLDLEKEVENDENVQEYGVKEIVVHPNYTSRYHYHDIALVWLNESVRVTTTVTPACLWSYPFVKFSLLEACGYGQTSYLGSVTPRLLKVELSPVSDKECLESYDENRKLPHGIQSTQFCARDFSNQTMDTCLGDSGGPLQIKLLANGRMTPFIIGITSFGRACGDGTPGVYTRISSYLDWIESETKVSSDPKECIKRYAEYREFEDEIILQRKTRKWGGWMEYDTTRAHVDVYSNNLNHRVTVVDENQPKRCGGVILTETYVLTISECVTDKIFRVHPIYVEIEKDTKIEVKYVFHRNLDGLTPEYDIALLELMTPIKFSDTIHPVCLWPDTIPADMELEINGWGDRDYHNVYFDANDSPGFGYISIRAKAVNDTKCSDNHLCYGNSELHILPDTCELDVGGPLERKYYPLTFRFFPYVMGINAYGDDCGFGMPSVSVKVSKAIDWIDSIIFYDEKNTGNALERVKREQLESKAYNESHKFELEDCPHIYERYRKKSGQQFRYDDMPIYPHTVNIGSKNFFFPCHGVLITNQHVLASYSCLYNPRNLPFKFTPELIEVGTEMREIAWIDHYENRTTLIKMNDTINLSFETVPACIWLEKDTTPFELTILRPGYEKNEPSYIPVRPYQNNICKHLRNDTKNTQELLKNENYGCLSFIYGKTSCDFEDNRVIVQAVRNISETIVPFIVGIIDTNAECHENKPLIYARIAYDVDWIRQHL